MQPEISEIVIECERPERKRLFQRKQEPQRWTAHRNVWNVPEDDFQLKFLVSAESGSVIEYREFEGQLFRPGLSMQWLLEDFVRCQPEEFESLVIAAQSFGIHDVYCFEGYPWRPVSTPHYEVVFTDAACPMVIVTDIDHDGNRYGHDNLGGAMEEASALSNGTTPVVSARIEAIKRFTDPVDSTPGEKLSRPSPLSPVAEMVIVRWEEVATLRDKLFKIVEEPTSPTSDIVAQLSAVNSSVRRLLDDARMLNNDPDAR